MTTQQQTGSQNPPWHEANQRVMTAAIDLMAVRLEHHAHGDDDGREAGPGADSIKRAEHALAQANAALPAPSALDGLAATFSLSPFERDLITLCAGIEFRSGFSRTCAAAQPGTGRDYPTFGLGLAALSSPHWSALLPDAPLRHWRLLEVGSGPVTTARLSIDERILHHLAGLSYLDERLRGIIEPLPAGTDAPGDEQRDLARQLTLAWSRESPGTLQAQLCGRDHDAIRSIARQACQDCELNLLTLSAQSIPANPAEFEAVVRLWTREAHLTPAALLLECHYQTDPARLALMERWITATRTPLILSSDRPCGTSLRPLISLEIEPPDPAAQTTIWTTLLGEQATSLNGEIARLTDQFRLSAPSIRNAWADGSSRAALAENDENSAALGECLWEACVRQGRPPLEPLAQRIDSQVGWDDLVLPARAQETLHQIPLHVRQRRLVHDEWGFASREQRGLGISALFFGPSGTGKTMAAEVIANELHLDLFRIDLSSVVSKYIGETESNLRQVFDAAECGGAVLLFDEADALFGKRSEVKDSRDRFANIEVSYLLQRMEAYRGLAILTTNRKDDLDPAFLRRLRFVVGFPFPDHDDRTRIWERIFPDPAPTADLDSARLAQLTVAGGNIRNIALHAAFLAAGEGAPVRMPHLLAAARTEFAKIERTLTESETRGWI